MVQYDIVKYNWCIKKFILQQYFHQSIHKFIYYFKQ